MAGQVWATDTLGGYMYSLNLSKELRYALKPMVKFRQFADAKNAVGKKKGQLFTWNVYSKVATAGTVLAESTTIPETNFTITQGTMTITEFGNSVPFTEKLDNLSAHSVKEIINEVLKRDAASALDTAAHAQFAATPLRYVATTATDAGTLYANGTATGTNNVALGKGHIKDIVDKMKERDIPGYTADDYYCIAHPSTLRQFRNDVETLHSYTDKGFQMIMNGEIGRYEGVRFVEQTNIAKAGFTTNNKSNWAFFFGSDTVAEGIAVPEEIRGKIPTDYGRSQGIAWYFLGGFALVHSAAANARVVKWDSQA